MLSSRGRAEVGTAPTAGFAGATGAEGPAMRGGALGGAGGFATFTSSRYQGSGDQLPWAVKASVEGRADVGAATTSSDP